MWREPNYKLYPTGFVRLGLASLILTSALALAPQYLGATPVEELALAEQTKREELTITILDHATRQPIIGAVIRCSSAISPTMTDKMGRATLRFRSLPANIPIEVTCVGYQRLSRTVAIPSTRLLTLQLQEDAQVINKVEVTARKRHTSKLQQTATIDHKTIDRAGATSLAKLLETIPGVSSISSGSTIAKPVIQGMHSSRILLMNNGVRLESQSWGADHAPELDYTGSSMVEVVKGAECIRYGFGAMGGVVLLNDAPLPFGKEKITIHGKANVGYDTNARGGSGSASLEAGYRQWGLRVHGMYTKGGDYHTADYILNNTGYNTISLSGALGFHNEHVTANLYSSLYYQRSGIYYAVRSLTSISSLSASSMVAPMLRPSAPSPTISSLPSSSRSTSRSRVR